MKLTIFIIIISILQASAKISAQRINLSGKKLSTITLLNRIQEQSGYDIFYKAHQVKDIKVNVSLVDVSVETALKAILDNQNLSFSIEDRLITIFENRKDPSPSSSILPTSVHIKGIVEDEEGKPLVGAFVQVLGRNVLGMNTGEDGTFSFDTNAGDTTIRVSFVGYRQETVHIIEGKTYYRITLTITDANLKEVVTTGMFNKPKESFTGAVTVITKEQIKLFGNRNLLKTIANIDPSFNITERNQYGSDPNVMPDIDIRGSTTLASVNDLQSNVRNTLNLPLFILDGFEVTLQRVYDMNQSDVESVVILKDASSTAMYGSRGANGVVVITSIKPVAGKLKVSYSTGINLEMPDVSSYNLLNATDKLALEKSVGLYTATDYYSQDLLSTLYNANLKSIKEGVNTNWAKVPLHTGVGQYHKLDLSGGDAQFRYVMNVSYNQITGAMKGSKRDNFNGSMNIMYLLKKVHFSNNLTIGFDNAANSTYGDYSTYVSMNPYWNPYNADGTPVKMYNTFGSQTQPNPAYNGSLTDFNKSQYTSIRNTTSIDWDISKAFKWRNSVGYSRQVGGTDVFTSPSNSNYWQTTDVSLKGSYTKGNSFEQGYQFSTNLSYGQVFGLHSIFLGANAQMLENKSNTTSMYVTGFINDQETDISNGYTYSGDRPSTSESTVRSVEFSGTMNYNYNSRYFADASYNVSGGSSFGPNTRYGKFWSVGFGWTLSNEKFFRDNISFINLLRLRYNYGVSGGLNFEPYQSLTTYSYDRTALYRTLIGTTLTALGNTDLSWQNSFQHNYGIDISLFNGRISLTANYYRKNTPNTITQAYLPISHGFTSYTENMGEVRNTGMDLSLSTYIIRDDANKFSWAVTTSISNNKNVLVKLSDALKKANETYASQNSSSGLYYEYVEGQSIDEVYVVKSPGVDATSGKVLYQNLDGTITTSISGVGKIPVGSSQPKINGRMSTMLRYGSFVVNIGFAARFGGKKLNQTLLSRVENAYVRLNVDKRVGEKRWQKAGDITPYKSILNTDNTYANDRFVFTENTIMLNNINMSYELPMKWVKRMKMQRIAVSASMSDMFYWSNIEQERGTSYPYTLKPSFSLSCTF